MADFPSPRKVISDLMSSRNATGRSFHLTYDSEPKVDGMSGGIVYIGTVPHSVGSGATDGAAIVVTKTRRNSTIGGDTIYSVSMGSGDSEPAEEGLTSVYVIPITKDGEDNRDMVCYADTTDDSDIEDTDIEPYTPKDDSDPSSRPDDSSSSSSSGSHHSSPNSDSSSEGSLDYCRCDVDQYKEDCSRVWSEIYHLKSELERIGIDDPSEWHEVPSDGLIYHARGYIMHLAGTGGSGCPLCNPGAND